MEKKSALKTVSATLFALTAFAANSVLCRLALGNHTIDPASFTIVRLVAGAITLAFIVALSNRKIRTPYSFIETIKIGRKNVRQWTAPLMLFVYAITFSFAYTLLSTATGALILFGVVQLSMIVSTFLSGHKLHYQEWLGMAIACIGFIILMLPSATKPSFNGFVFMSIAGIAWAIYTLSGRQSLEPLLDTATNFYRTVPLVLVLAVLTLPFTLISTQGILLAIASGAIASGIGYAVWYIALRGLSVTQAAVTQLSVPLIAALGGVMIVAEPLTERLLWSLFLVLGGITLVVFSQTRAAAPD